ncbi:MAG TPA: GPW/gp25 family protein [Actinophytocola sp.]|uniref:GPW/gp25 family protein n=1 Tax=Actinophytocola sp. TaxID=1872138 RepID=UPI002DBEBF34|nr:GPW/gp25 family protein [Actinophytocola sp.]HEU5474596.1 GPW/gp25 family protein [Actinophytocola sp.]
MTTQDFVGAGWAFPLGVGPQGGIALVRREVELEQAMRLILSTYPGERPMRPEFGSRIRDFVFRSVNVETISELSRVVRDALLRWEPRVDVEAVVITPDPADHSTLYIDIQYRPKDTNDRRNLVFPFYTIPEDGSDY